MELQHFSHDHPLLLRGENNLVPDDWHSCECMACGLPIFLTPSYICSRGCSFLLHKQCAHLPREVHTSFHHHTLTLVTEPPSRYSVSTCANCKCGPCNFMYLCLVHELCKSFVHIRCAFSMEFKILHRSHLHELIRLRGELSFPCGACGEEQHGSWYLCNLCGYWLHQHCASLPNTIRLKKHANGRHPLSLTYALHPPSRGPLKSYSCAICHEEITSLGAYFCGRCKYYAHIKCSTADPELYKLVSSQEIELDPDVIRFPMADEFTSVVHYLERSESKRSSTNENITEDTRSGNLFEDKHDHPLIFHDDTNDKDHHHRPLLICDGCVEPISGPHYSCSQPTCSSFFLHRCCANLPPTLPHPAHEEHTLVLLKRPQSHRLLSQFTCSCCERQCNGFAYGCEDCGFCLDIVCAFLPEAITHEAHGRRHVLVLEYSTTGYEFNCCTPFETAWYYTCSSCGNFRVHAHCALLPSTIRHKFDPHPLRLITSFEPNYASDEHFCEICEGKFFFSLPYDKNYWYYHCAECDQSFHFQCIPSLSLYRWKIKFGGAIQVQCHDCPVSSIRMLTVGSHRCGYCREIIQGFKDKIAFECSKCYFKIHYKCAEKCRIGTPPSDVSDEDAPTIDFHEGPY